jgi:hypothetical protein
VTSAVLEVVRDSPEYAETQVYGGEIDDADFKINFRELWSRNAVGRKGTAGEIRYFGKMPK